MKLLAADPKPGPKPGSGHANFASSSSTPAAAPPSTRTRDLPNLFDCHFCGCHINRDNLRDRPQPLDSLWRVVLLCNKCRQTIGSGKTCPYCFRETGKSEDIWECSECGRKIHKDCVRGYGNCSPWCYLGVEYELEESGVCVDCWVPDMLKNSTRVHRSENKHGLKHAECENEALKRRKSMDNDELDSLGKMDENVNSLSVEFIDLVNQSRGIVNNLVNSGPPDALNIRGFNGLRDEQSGLGKDGGGGEKFGLCANDAVNERMGRHRSDQYNGRFGRGLLSYRRAQFRQKACQGISSHDTSEGSSNINGPFKDVNGLYAVASEGSHHKSNGDVSEGCCDVGVVYDKFGRNLAYERDKWRKKWHNVIFDKFGREPLSYKRTRLRGKSSELSGLVDVHCVSNVDGSSPGLLTYKRKKGRKRWQLYG